jgi:hypothetical protein
VYAIEMSGNRCEVKTAKTAQYFDRFVFMKRMKKWYVLCEITPNRHRTNGWLLFASYVWLEGKTRATITQI